MSNRPNERRWPAWLTIYLLMLAALLSAGLAAYFTRSQSSRGGHFVILQVNDVYRIEGIEKGTVGSLARVRTIRRHLEKVGLPVLMLHAGDFLNPSIMSKYLQARPMMAVMNRMDGEADAFDSNLIATFGNHEFEDPGFLLDRIRESEFSWVSSNVRYQDEDGVPEPFSKRFQNVHDVIVKDIDGTRVGILGITCDIQKAKGISYNYDDPGMRDEIIRSALARLEEQGANVIIALTHQDLEEDLRIAKAFPKIHLIVGGHEHSFLKRRVGGTLITKADADARSVIRIDVKLSPDGTVTAVPEKITVGPGVLPDEQIDSASKAWMAELAGAFKKKGKALSAKVGSTASTLEGVETAIRTRETALGDFLADVMRSRTGVSIAFINGGSIRINDNIPAGSDITTYDLEGIFYYDSSVVTFKLTGSQLLEILRRSVSQTDRGHGRFLQVSGVRFIYHVEGSEEEPKYRIDPEEVWVLPAQLPETSGPESYLPLDLKETYTVATTKYLWERGSDDGYELFSEGKRPPLNAGQQLDLRAITEAALGRQQVTTKIDGRILRRSTS